MFQRFKKFLSAHFTALPDDLEQPFVKKADLILKTAVIIFALTGFWLIFSSAIDYSRETRALFTSYNQVLNSGTGSIANTEQLRLTYEIQKDQMLFHIFYKLILGFALVVCSFVFNNILMAEYISFTLPDKIYFRCFSTKEEKEKKKKFQERT